MPRPDLGAIGVSRIYALSQDGINSALDAKSTKTEKTIAVRSTDPNLSISGILRRAPAIELVTGEELESVLLRVRLHLESFEQNSNIILPNNQIIALNAEWKIVLEGSLCLRQVPDLSLLPDGIYKSLSIPPGYKAVDKHADNIYAVSLDPDISKVSIITASDNAGINPALETYIAPFTEVMQKCWNSLAIDKGFDLMYVSFPTLPILQISEWDNSEGPSWIPDQDYSNIPGGGNELLAFNTQLGRPAPILRANWVTPGKNGALWIPCQDFFVRNVQNAIYNLPQMLDERDTELNYDRHGDPNYPDNFPPASWVFNSTQPFSRTLSINNTRPGSTSSNYPIVEKLELTMSCQPPLSVQLVGTMSIQFIGLYKGNPIATYKPTSNLILTNVSDNGFLYLTPIGKNSDGTYRSHLGDPTITPGGAEFGSIFLLYLLYSGPAFVRYMAGVDGTAQDPSSPTYTKQLLELFPIGASLPGANFYAMSQPLIASTWAPDLSIALSIVLPTKPVAVQ